MLKILDKFNIEPEYIDLGGGLFGISGMLLASPTIATIKLCYDGAIKSYLSNHKELKTAISNETEGFSEEEIEDTEKTDN